jgi:ubiquinone/menaquinone biosynthesis C-methylase UbiE
MGGQSSKRAGQELAAEYRPGFHDRLAEHWPEPREQLHAGGWPATRQLVRDLAITATDRVLDICCGEGATACWIARTIGAKVIGIDLIADAIAVAQRHARRERVEQLCSFVCGTIFELPFADKSFDVILGQDPDGLAHQQRLVAFQECYRVMRPGGRFAIQHWVPGLGAPPALCQQFDLSNADVGFPSHKEVHADAYVEALRAACFRDVRVVDASPRYRRHMQNLARRAREQGQAPDIWTQSWLDLSRRHPFGVLVFARKPLSSSRPRRK